jgi:hypothetical protein
VTPAEAVELLTLAAAFDRRTVGEADARAWAAALHNVPLDQDARAAVARHFAESTEWFTPAHARSVRHRIRAERLAGGTPLYEPPPGDETGEQYLARRRAQIRAIADGREQPVYVALPAGDRAERDTEAARRLAALGTYVPRAVAEDIAGHRPRRAERERLAAAGRPDPLDVPCPWDACRRPAGEPCRNRRGQDRTTPHPSREDAATARHHAQGATA